MIMNHEPTLTSPPGLALSSVLVQLFLSAFNPCMEGEEASSSSSCLAASVQLLGEREPGECCCVGGGDVDAGMPRCVMGVSLAAVITLLKCTLLHYEKHEQIMSKGLNYSNGSGGAGGAYFNIICTIFPSKWGHKIDLSTTTRLHAPVCQGYADVPDFELVALQVVSGQSATRRGRAPATAEDKERMLQIGLDRHL